MTGTATATETEIEHPLTGGTARDGVVRVGNTVRRSVHPRSDFVRRMLTRLGEADVQGVPRHLGIDAAGREIFSFLPGETFHARKDWTDAQVGALAVIVRTMHDALAEIAAPDETWCHRDIAPWNVVVTEGLITGVFDFDDAGPGRRADDVAHVAWTFLGLGRPGRSAVVLAPRLRRLCEAYDGGGSRPLPPGGSVWVGIVDAVQREQDRIYAWHHGQSERLSDPDARAWNAMRAAEIAGQRAWMERYRAVFEGFES